ncbi:MAG: hypothetical protein JWQ90_1008 [Hydrocarboniphaga sp.]|uniref:DUF4336 domain-containing protein n=1 Tax=Hydrocarboniphaga sp. TaxID=2033016 RepID=UPI0026107A6D|nr:DUF4336 domain-containing protein [Hydrocarboniphaga sp.]MDB5968558.1 hypothetical protein [Hydrocarboniphaga sp.]
MIDAAALTRIDENLWITSIPHRFVGLHIGTRMTVVRLSSGEVLLHSPVALTDELRRAIDAIGPVKHIVCPNMFHHSYAGEAVRAYPAALLYGPSRLQKKRRDLRFTATLSDTPHPAWSGELLPTTIAGSLMAETVLYHVPSRTLITSDLVENFADNADAFTRWYLKLGGILGKVGWHPLLRLVYVNRRKARASMAKILALPFDRVIVAHGDIITANAKESLRQGMRWL